MKLVEGLNGWAVRLSDDELFRYWLVRPVPEPTGELLLVSCGLNPSTADAFRNDQTMDKEVGFAKRWGCSTVVKINGYAWRETKPKVMFSRMRAGGDIVGSENDEIVLSCLREVKRRNGIPLAAWGRHLRPDRAKRLCELAEEAGVQWRCIGINQDGSPWHTLYRPYESPLVPWKAAM